MPELKATTHEGARQPGVAARCLGAGAAGVPRRGALAVPNWLLRRDDQVGCVLFTPVDALERRAAVR